MTTTTTTNPTILFVHGSWHSPKHFAPIMAKLEAAGYPCVCPQQPSFNIPSARMKTQKMYEDARAIRSVLDQLVVAEERDVVVVLHSYGGVVGTEATHASLGKEQRTAQGQRGGVVRLVYMCAFMLPPNASLGDAFGGALPPFIRTEEDGSCNMLDPRTRFYSGLDDAAAAHWLAQTEPHPAIAQLTPITYTAYAHHPLAYIVCTEDKALLPDVQRAMIAQCRTSGFDLDEYEVPADHSPYLSRQEETMAVLRKIAGDASVLLS